MTEDEIKTTAQDVLREVLGDRLVRVSAAAGLDHDGDPAIYLSVFLEPGIERLGGRLTADAIHRVRSALLAKGDDRFPYLGFLYPDDELHVDESHSQAQDGASWKSN